MQHVLDIASASAHAAVYESYIEETEPLLARATTSDCLSTGTTVSSGAGSTVGCFFCIGCITGTGGYDTGCSSCHE